MNTSTFNLVNFKTTHFGKSSKKSLMKSKTNLSGILMRPKKKRYSSYLHKLSEIYIDSKKDSKNFLNIYENKPLSSKTNNKINLPKTKLIKKEEKTDDPIDDLKQIEELIKQKLIKMNKRIEMERSFCEPIKNNPIYEPEINLNTSNRTSPLTNIERIHKNYSKTFMIVPKKSIELNKNEKSNSNVLNNSSSAIHNKTIRKMTLDNTQQSNISIKLNVENNNEKYRTLEIKSLVFDSMDEEEESNENISCFYISAESKFIFIFDFFVIIFTVYTFIFYPL